MNVNKRNNYQLTGSIHTLSLISLPVTDIDESIAPCFDTLSSRENLSYSKINANKLVGDLFSYDEFKTAFDTILGGAGIESYSLSRFDMRFDSFDPEHYRDYAKLNRYLISALAVTYGKCIREKIPAGTCTSRLKMTLKGEEKESREKIRKI